MVNLDNAFLNTIGSGFLMRSRNVKIVNFSDGMTSIKPLSKINLKIKLSSQPKVDGTLRYTSQIASY